MLVLKWQGKIFFSLKFDLTFLRFFFLYLNRIRTELEGGAWCPDKPIGPKSNEYIQIEFHQLIFLTAVETQGRFDNGQGNEYAEFYQIQYQRENHSSNWIDYFNRKTNKTVRDFLLTKRNQSFFFFVLIANQRKCQYIYSWKTFSLATNSC